MKIIGLHFGHDASITIIIDGKIVAHVLAERHNRVKHSVGLRADEMDAALSAAGLDWREIDCCAVVSTQDLEIMTGLVGDDFAIRPGDTKQHPVPSPFMQLLESAGTPLESLLVKGLQKVAELDEERAALPENQRWTKIFPEWQKFRAGRVSSIGWLNVFIAHERWNAGRGMEDIRTDGIDPAMFGNATRLGMHIPVTVSWKGHSVPGYFVDHHVCHAASAFYRSGFECGAIITHDGGDASRNLSGLFCYGQGSRLFTLGPHHLALGGIYRAMGIKLGFGAIGPEGKLMGLSSYGQPRFFDSRFVGNVHDSQKRFGEGPFSAWYRHCLKLAERGHYDLQHGEASQVLNPISVDMAASTQKLFEEGYLLAAEVLHQGLAESDRGTANLCLTGGAALNCPSNSRLYNESAFRDIYIDPNCDDGGLSVGGALFIFHNLMDHPVDEAAAKNNRSPFFGLPWPAGLSEEIFVDAGHRYAVSKPDNMAASAAKDLDENKVLALYEGRSEMGPRALCHRSVLANPTDHGNWARVNGIKGREAWRPFAPVVIEEKMQDWFAGCPTHSPYMLFTARVRSRRLPAITHVDGSSRIQTASAETGAIYQILREFDALTGIPVLMNTSLNGPGVPIVERPSEAYELFKDSAVDVLYLNGTRIGKK